MNHGAKYGKEYSDAFYLMLLQGINYLLPLILIPFLMVRLGSEGYGKIGFATAFVQYIVLISDFGFNLSATKALSQAHEKGDREGMSRIFTATLAAKMLLLTAATVLFAAIGAAVPGFRRFLPVVAATYPMAIGMAFTFTWLFQGLGRIRILSLINIISKLAVLPLIFILVKGPQHVILAALVQSGVYVVAAIVSLVYLLGWKPICITGIGKKDLKDAFRESTPLFLSTASTSVYTQLFTVLLALFVTPAALGCYSAAERIMRAGCFVLFTPVNQAFFPRIAALAGSAPGEAVRLKNAVFRLTAALMAAVAAIMLAGSGFAERFAGEGYNGLSTLLRILSVTPLFIGLGGVSGQMGLIALGDERAKKSFMMTYITAAPVSLGLLLALCPWCGTTGAAVALLLTEGFVCLSMTVKDRRRGR